MAANLNGNTQSYQPFAIRILQGTMADVVAIQEFNYTSTNGLGVNTPAAFREMIDTAFGTNYVYYREPFTGNGDIPNGIISRYPIIASGSWADAAQSLPNRGFAWAQIDLPGTNDLYVVSVHLLTDTSKQPTEATNLKSLIQANFPGNAWIVVAGDFNTSSRTTSAMQTFKSYLNDFPIPVDNVGNSDTSGGRNSPHDYVLPSSSLTNFETATVFPSHSFPSGLVFDSAVYTPLSDVPPVLSGDSGQAQHMAVMKDFSIPSGSTNVVQPAITVQPQGVTNAVGSSITFGVTAAGSSPFAYQWLFGGTNISGAVTNPYVIASAQLTNNWNYSVIITNGAGNVTSSVAVLLTTNAPPNITTQPSSQTVNIGAPASLSVTASGTSPLNYQWRFGGTNIAGVTTNPFTVANVQLTNAGDYSVVISNFVGSVTSSAATLSVFSTQSVVIAQWNFNSVVSDGMTGTGTRTASVGSGANSYVGGTAAAGSGEFASGSGSGDPNSADNSAWNTSTYPAASANNKTAGVQFNVSTAGRQNIVISWASQTSSTGSKYGRLQYSTNGTTFTDFPSSVINPTAFTTKTNSLTGFAGVNDNTNFAFRIVSEFEATATGAGASSYV
ncbi:MAG: immunoglobulin domain-containing protein, partial [Verrucomicrobia bacterium]|nr:immunoglobulin domain-containing protein [Verrucomicrobiota bacterium]